MNSVFVKVAGCKSVTLLKMNSFDGFLKVFLILEMTKVCEKFKFVIISVRDKNSNFFIESVISFHFVNPFSDTASWLFFQDL